MRRSSPIWSGTMSSLRGGSDLFEQRRGLMDDWAAYRACERLDPDAGWAGWAAGSPTLGVRRKVLGPSSNDHSVPDFRPFSQRRNPVQCSLPVGTRFSLSHEASMCYLSLHAQGGKHSAAVSGSRRPQTGRFEQGGNGVPSTPTPSSARSRPVGPAMDRQPCHRPPVCGEASRNGGAVCGPAGPCLWCWPSPRRSSCWMQALGLSTDGTEHYPVRRNGGS